MKKLLVALVVVALAGGYAVTRGMRAGVSLISRNSEQHVECFYLHWDGRHRKVVDLTGQVVNPNTNSYCPFLED
jgi:hypothetical protein